MIDNTIKVSLEEMYGSESYRDCYFYFRKPRTSELLTFNQANVDLEDMNKKRVSEDKSPLEATPELALAMENLVASCYVRGDVIGTDGIETLSKEYFSIQFLDMQTVSYVFPIILNVEGLESLKPKSEQDSEQTK